MMETPEYDYEVKEVDNDHNQMVVEYKSKDLPAVLVSMPLPYADDDFDLYVLNYSPIGVWESVVRQRATVTVGKVGKYKPVKPPKE
jgi:hypothetical protein